MHRLASLKTPIVRDLAYACFDKPLIEDFSPLFSESLDSQLPKNCHLQLTEERYNWLKQLDQNPNALFEHLNKNPQTRLGYYYESLWHFFIEQDPNLKLIAKNQKIYEGKKTLGEIDIIYQCLLSEKFYHLELAIKFYMQLGKNPNHIQYYYGSNQRDRFDKKLSKLLKHQSQFCINRHKESIQQLWHQEKIINEIALHGFLFYPLNNQQKNQLIYSSHNYGQWLPLFNIDTIIENHEHWTSLQRLKWISPALNPQQQVYHKKEIKHYLKQYIQNIDDCLMIAGLQESPNGLIEQQRYMITPDHWADKIYYQDTEC